MKNALLASIAFVFLLTACSKEGKLARRLDGVWNVERLELQANDGSDNSYTATNIGTITFEKDGTGKNDFDYSFEYMGSTYSVTDSESFKWSNTAETVTIKGNSNSGEQIIVWNVDDNEKNTQIWTRTDVDGNDWELELTKQD